MCLKHSLSLHLGIRRSSIVFTIVSLDNIFYIPSIGSNFIYYVYYSIILLEIEIIHLFLCSDLIRVG